MLILVISLIMYLLGLSYYYNSKNKENLELTNILFTIMDAVIVIMILYLTIMSGFVFQLYTIFIVFFVLLILLYIRVQDGNLINDNFELKFEPFKNTLIIFILTVYPFFIFMTILRYTPWFIQISISLLLVVGILLVMKYFKKAYHGVIRYFQFKIRTDGARKFFYIWGIFGFVIVIAFLFNMPRNDINNFLNLNNHRPIYDFTNGYPIDLRTNYETTLIDEVESTTPILSEYVALSDEGVSRHGDLDIFNMRVFRDEVNDITYTSYVVNSDFTVYIKEDNLGNEEIYEISGVHNTNGYVIDDIIYLTGKGNTLIEIMDGEFKINGIYNLQPSVPIFEGNRFSFFDFLGAKIDGEVLNFTTLEVREGIYYYKEYELQKIDIDLYLPFYSHYSYGAILIVILFMFIPITDYKKHITVIDLKKQYKKDD